MKTQLFTTAVTWVLSFAIAARFFTLELAFAISLGTAAFIAALLQLRAVHGEGLEDLTVGKSDGLRTQISSTASAFRRREMPGSLQIRIAQALDTHIRVNQLPPARAHELFGPDFFTLIDHPDRMSDSQARHLVVALRKDSSHD